MMGLRHILLTGVAAGSLATMSIPAYAVPGPATNIVSNQWYTGQFSSSVGSALSGPGFASGIGVQGPINPTGTYQTANQAPTGTSWTIDLAYGGYLTVTDVETSGDQFQLFNNAVSLGTTSTPGTKGGDTSCIESISCALGDSNYSSGTFTLPVGADTITGTVAAFYSSGSFDFIVQANPAPDNPNPAPEPATIAVFGVGMAGLAAARRRKRAA